MDVARELEARTDRRAVSEKREAPRIEMLSDGTIAGGMIANTKYKICHEGCPDGGNARCGTPGTRVQAGTLTDCHNLDGLDELAF